MNKSQYEFWIFQQEEPDLSEIISHRKLKQEPPTWFLKQQENKRLREKIGEEEYMKMEKDYQERKERLRKYEGNEES